MKVIIKNAYVYRSDVMCALPQDVLCEDGLITAVDAWGSVDAEGAEVIDATGCYLYPGLVDVHTHGRSGADFCDCSDGELHRMCRDYAASGVTTVMPTLASAPLEEMARSARQMTEFVPDDGEATLCGVHLEGRYLAPAKRGAHAIEMLSSLDCEELELFRGIAPLHISAAYEMDGDGSFAARALEMGATLGLGHTCATYSQAKAAQDRGVTSYTHLFNAMPPLHHREGGAVAACLAGECYGELICDGVHIAPEVIRTAYRCLGEDRTSLITDSMSATGCADGEYSIAGEPVTVKDGRALTHSGALAGSTLTLDRAVNNLAAFCGIPLSRAILCATATPAKQMGIFDRCGSIDVGKSADILFCDGSETQLNVKKIMLRGRLI